MCIIMLNSTIILLNCNRLAFTCAKTFEYWNLTEWIDRTAILYNVYRGWLETEVKLLLRNYRMCVDNKVMTGKSSACILWSINRIRMLLKWVLAYLIEFLQL